MAADARMFLWPLTSGAGPQIEVIVDESTKKTSAFAHAMHRQQCMGWA
jgi:hypothetical protein